MWRERERRSPVHVRVPAGQHGIGTPRTRIRIRIRTRSVRHKESEHEHDEAEGGDREGDRAARRPLFRRPASPAAAAASLANVPLQLQLITSSCSVFHRRHVRIRNERVDCGSVVRAAQPRRRTQRRPMSDPCAEKEPSPLSTLQGYSSRSEMCGFVPLA